MDKDTKLSEEEKQERLERGEAIVDLLVTLRKIDKEQAKMTPEEKKRNEWAAWDGDEMLFKY